MYGYEWHLTHVADANPEHFRLWYQRCPFEIIKSVKLVKRHEWQNRFRHMLFFTDDIFVVFRSFLFLMPSGKTID